MGAIRLDRRVSLEKQVATDVGGGVTETTWQEHAEVWARVKPLSGYEYYQAQQATGGATHEITIRRAPSGAPNPDSDMRLNYDSRTMSITAIMETEDRKFYKLIAAGS